MRPLGSHAIRAQTKSFGILGWVFYCEPGWPKTVRGTEFSEVCSHNDMDRGKVERHTGAQWTATSYHNEWQEKEERFRQYKFIRCKATDL